MNKVIRYMFSIKADSPVYFGSSDQKKIPRDSKGDPLVFGSGICGAVRTYISDTDVTLIEFFGGVDENADDYENRFIESRICVSDAKICGGNERVEKKEGTKIDPAQGTAEESKKYGHEYIQKGSYFEFGIECEIFSPKEEDTFKKIIASTANGIEGKRIVFGGKRSNGFGRFTVDKVRVSEYDLEDREELEKYVDEGFSGNARADIVQWREMESFGGKKSGMTVKMAGSFPYGVYQGFDVEDEESAESGKDVRLTGIRCHAGEYSIPGSSIKGAVKGEMRKFILRLTEDEEKTKAAIENIFGNTKKRGTLIFRDMEIEAPKKVQILRYQKNSGNRKVSGNPIYNKIDRFSGGCFDGALKHQVEIKGRGLMEIEAAGDFNEAYMFPLMYVLRQMGLGRIGIGGRGSTGLGEFNGKEIIAGGSTVMSFEDLDKDMERMRPYHEKFERWCSDGGNI